MGKKSKRENYRIIERHLENYHSYQVSIENCKRQLDNILPNITANYELREGSTGSFTFSSSTENAVLDRMQSKDALDLVEKMNVSKLIVESIDRALEVLSPFQQKFVQVRYFRGCSAQETMDELGLARTDRVRESVLEKLVISLYNILNL